MNVAVVDIGSNSTRLLIAEIEDHRVRRELVRHSEVTRLGAGVDADGRLRDDAMQRVYTTLDDYKAEIDAHGAQAAVAVLTSAVRDSANGQEFADTVRDRYGLEPHVLTGDEEAQLTFLGATSERDAVRPHADAGARHRRRVDRDDHRQRAARSASTSPPRPEWCARPSATSTPTRRTRPRWTRWPPTCAGSSRTAFRRSGAARSSTGSPWPEPPPRWPRSPSTWTPTTPSASMATC